MAPPNVVSTQIEIAAPPETVRSVFLDFQHYNKWSQGYQLSTLGSGTPPSSLRPGDRIKVDMKGTVFHPVIVVRQENSLSSFQWRGSLYGLFVGTHQFHFSASKANVGGTTLVNEEHFSGPLAFLEKPGWKWEKQTRLNFEGFNEDLKAAVEKGVR